jgi:uncharacterized membrane protein
MKITSARSNRGWNKICSKWNIFCSKLSIFEFIYICLSIIYDIGFSTGGTTFNSIKPLIIVYLIRGFFMDKINSKYFKMNLFQIYLMGSIYIFLGIFHFTHTDFYKPMMPKFLPKHELLIYMSGLLEILLGLGVLFQSTRNSALISIILMLVVFLVVHINMLFPGNQLGIPTWILWLRIPIQFLLMYWTYINIG